MTSKYLRLTLSNGSIVEQGFRLDAPGHETMSDVAMADAARTIVGSEVFGAEGTVVGTVVEAVLVTEPDRDEPIEQFDPALQSVQGTTWFMQAALLVEQAASILANNGVHKGTLFAGGGRLSLDDPFAGALVEIASLPVEGLTFAVVRVPDLPDALDDSRKLHELSEKVRAANPNASLLLLPSDWSFRTMVPEMAIQFATNMIAFVSDQELAKVGLYRKDPA